MSAKSVFIVDDNPEDLKIIHEAFREITPFTDTDVFKSGKELFTKLSKGIVPSLILLDLEMPVSNGIEVLKKLKATEVYSKIPVIIFSESKDISKINECYQLKATSFIRKPADYADLAETIRTIDFMLAKF